MEKIKSDIKYLIRTKALIKRLQEKEKETRQKLLDVAKEATTQDYLLAKKSVAVPKEFWIRTGCDPLSFVLTRFPTWDLLETEHNTATFNDLFILQRKPEYEGWVWEDEEIKVIKVVQEGTPDVDWDSLDKEFPNLKAEITDKIETVTYELNGDKLQEKLKQDPQFLVKLERHLLPKEPVLQIRTSTKKKKK